MPGPAPSCCRTGASGCCASGPRRNLAGTSRATGRFTRPIGWLARPPTTPGQPAPGLRRRRLGLGYPHVLRETVAIVMDHAGLSSRAAAGQLGHANTSMSTDVYSATRSQ